MVGPDANFCGVSDRLLMDIFAREYVMMIFAGELSDPYPVLIRSIRSVSGRLPNKREEERRRAGEFKAVVFMA